MRIAAAVTLRRRRLPRLALAVPHKVRRGALIAVLLALVLLAAYRFWFRDSSFVSIQNVTVSGLTTKDAPRIRTALIAAAHDMTTLDMDQSALEGSVASFPVVRAVVAKPQFPHGLRIHVIEERPVAVLVVGGQRLLLAPDGSVLRGVTTGHPLPLIRTHGSVPQDMLTDHAPLTALHVAAAAPAALAGRISSIGHGDTRGIVVRLRNGLVLIFGDDSRPYAKWAAVAAVLADPSSRGASYIDVRLPGRPVAGGLAAETLAPLTSNGTDASAQSNNAQTPVAGTTGTTGATAATAPPATSQTPDTQSNPQPSGGP